jgi:hypothetical protein
VSRDWRLPENRREAFQRQYSFHLQYGIHPGCVYQLLPAISDALNQTPEQRAWTVWLNGNTQNPVTTWILLQAAPHPRRWQAAVELWNDRFTDLAWDTDRRHQKSKFGEATQHWYAVYGRVAEHGWGRRSRDWSATWEFAKGQPYMGRLSAWSMIEYARILLPDIPDADSLLLDDRKGSQSHRNGLAVVDGYDAAYWTWDDLAPGQLLDLQMLGRGLLDEAWLRNPGSSDVSYLTLESALCTYKSWHKPNRRYPGVYADMAYDRIRWAEARWPDINFGVFWIARAGLPEWLRPEDGAEPMTKRKQNQYLETGVPAVLGHIWEDMR